VFNVWVLVIWACGFGLMVKGRVRVKARVRVRVLVRVYVL